MPTEIDHPLTELLQRSAAGDETAREALWDQLHDRLRGLARHRLAREGAADCDPTELVHEAFIKLEGLRVAPRDRLHFLGLAARAMRQVLVDQARRRRRDKRGGGTPDLTLPSQWIDADQRGPIDTLDLERALDALFRLDERKARAVELSYFGGLTDDEVAEVLGVSVATVKRDLRTARAWLATELP
ncbi:MAG: sigma-70 family RNA polymerase sigma factor [Gammaproteobacteria bacterium]|jgi:RNA polymerase sigma factor (TIGR02999 family)|nr:sigma-70 family RNA polymerase sigma factor [Gammaproteobacteria bacterium]